MPSDISSEMYRQLSNFVDTYTHFTMGTIFSDLFNKDQEFKEDDSKEEPVKAKPQKITIQSKKRAPPQKKKNLKS